MTAGSLRTCVGIALGDDPAELEAVDAVAHAHDERHVVLDDEHRRAELPADLDEQRAHRLGLALGDAGGRLVEAEHPGVEGQQAGQLDDAAGAGGQLGDGLVGVAAEAEEVDELGGLGPLGPLAPDGSRREERRSRAGRSGPGPRARPRRSRGR